LGLMNSNLEEVAEYFAFLLVLFPEIRFLILTSNRTVDIPAILSRYGLDQSSYAVRYPNKSELAEWLSAADAGIHAMSSGPDSATRLGVKIVEYLSCGLPILVNKYVGAAADLVRTYGVGVVVDHEDSLQTQRRLEQLFLNSSVPRVDCRRLAIEQFSNDRCAKKYLELYWSIAGNKIRT